MALQARAESTRRRIIEAAVGLFSQRGYGDTGLVDIVEAAALSKGAFYYHFNSKEEVATAIIDDYDNKLAATVLANIDPMAPTVADMVRSTFAVQELLCVDVSMQVGQLLMQAFEQISPGSRRVTVDWTDKFVYMVTAAHHAGELIDTVDPHEVGEAIWIAVLGSHVLSGALKDNPFARLNRSWRFILGAVAPRETLPGYHELLAALATEYSERAGLMAAPSEPGQPHPRHRGVEPPWSSRPAQKPPGAGFSTPR